MTEVSVESEGALPWVGGWLIDFGSSDASSDARSDDTTSPTPDGIRDLTQELEWTIEDGILHLICRHRAAPVEIRWQPGSSGKASVDLSLWTPTRPSATKADRARRLPPQS